MYWEYYGQYVLGSFSGIGFNQNANYTFIIYKKNYRGDAKNAVCAGNPATLRYLSDDPFGIKGSELVLNMLNIDNQMPLNYFYSEEDDTFKIEFKITYKEPDPNNPFSLIDITKTLFSGFLIQEDSQEVLTDITHQIQLSFTDNLGGLKNIDFFEASKMSATSAANLRTSSANMSVVAEAGNYSAYVGFFNNQSFGSPQVGDFIVINDSPTGDVAYTIIKIETISGIKRYYVREKVLPFSLTSNVKFSFVTGSNVFGRIKLKDAIRICLHGTNLNLNVNYAGNITARGSGVYTSTDIWDNVFVDGRTFMNDTNSWMSCYDVLEKLCKRFNISLFQQDGSWYMVRMFELPYTSNSISGRVYDGYLASQSTGFITSGNAFGVIEEGMEQSLDRPYNFYAESLKYKNPPNLLYNADLQILGPKITEYSTVINSINHTVKEYEAPGFNLNNSFTGLYKIFIRIWVNDVTKDEFDRVLVVKAIGSQTANIEVAITDLIEVNFFDEIQISLSYKNQLYSPNTANKFGFRNSINTTLNDHYYVSNLFTEIENVRKYVFVDYDLINPPSINYYYDNITSNDDSRNWRDLTINCINPRTGAFYLGLPFTDVLLTNAGETWFKNLKVQVISNTIGSNKTEGHEHKSSINKILRNNKNTEIVIDDTTKNSLSGTLFINSFSNLVQDKTIFWKDGQTATEYKLGEITTREVMNWKKIPRSKLEGKILGIIRSNYLVYKMYNALLFSVNNNTWYIFGKAEFDFRNDSIKCTLYEIYQEKEYVKGGVYREDVLYNFKYLYK